MTDKRETKKIVVNELYNKKKKGFYFYIQDFNEENPETVKYFLSDKDFRKRNLNVRELMNYIQDCCWRYGIENGIEMVDSYYKYD